MAAYNLDRLTGGDFYCADGSIVRVAEVKSTRDAINAGIRQANVDLSASERAFFDEREHRETRRLMHNTHGVCG